MASVIPVRNNQKNILKNFTGVNNTAKKLFSGVYDTADKFISGVNDLPILACLHMKF